MNRQELDYVSSLFHGLDSGVYSDLFVAMPDPILHKYYLHHVIPKHRGGVRHIYEPNESLKKIQYRIIRDILKNAPISSYAFAYVPGRSILDNAKPHVGNPILLKLDIHHFFDNIDFQAVQELIEGLGHSSYFARLIAGLVTIDDFLPQGAPTSPIISNMYLREFDEAIGGYCKRKNITYTRYSDDLTFSMHEFDPNLVKMVKNKLGALGLELNRKKSRVFSGPLQKRVTGVVVNEKPQAPINYRRKIRQEMYFITKFGLAKHLEHEGIPDEEKYLRTLLGRINFVLQINKDDVEFQKYKAVLLSQTPTLQNLRTQLKDLLD